VSDILHDLSVPALASAVEGNLFALLESTAHLPDAKIDASPELFRYTNPGILNPMFNSVLQVKTASDNVDRVIDETIGFFQSHQTPYWFWWTGPSTQPADIGARLVERGLLPYEIDAPGMAVNLHQLNITDSPDGFRITEVDSLEMLDQWVSTLIAGMEMPEFAAQSWRDASLCFGLDKLPWRMYLGWMNGTPAAVSMSVIGAGVVGLIAVGVIPELRNRGIGKAITLKPLLDARDQGYRVGVLFSTDIGLPVYERLGFQQVCTISRYLWRSA
jgi:GNAT superfamily N-acetyltransferase